MVIAVTLGWTLALVGVVTGGIVSNCVTERRDSLRTCVQSLKDATAGASDPDMEICSTSALSDLGCIHNQLDGCEDLQADDKLTAVLSDTEISDLVASASADVFCRCHKIAISLAGPNLKVEDPDSPFAIPNLGYVCGQGKDDILKASQTTDSCKGHLSRKNITDTDSVKKMGAFIPEHCDHVTDDFAKINECVEKRSTGYSFRRCVEMAGNYKEEEDLACGEIRCIRLHMMHCNETLMDIYIDAVNVFRHEHIPVDQCPSSACAILASLMSVIVMVTLSLVLRQ